MDVDAGAPCVYIHPPGPASAYGWDEGAWTFIHRNNALAASRRRWGRGLWVMAADSALFASGYVLRGMGVGSNEVLDYSVANREKPYFILGRYA
ncbi:hypothetical protein NDU88_000594 [Pleurodeles waltl]|uniref:Uncharacterized protein n=1 Tax=Pleurodeles waltl TaxID=8319 RepID=A0AAV7WL59_PLEWA|nr:hypothetical protein NDU88_000594 [Pleurodeles waltl]